MDEVQDKLNRTSNLIGKNETAIYVHVPFCARNCAYCKFYKVFPDLRDISLYIETLEKEANKIFEKRENFTVQSIFFGGGTPTCLSEKDLYRICKIFERFAGNIEWTVEAAPSTITPQKLKMLKNCGVNRISIGIQSFNQKTLDSLGRPHALKAALNAIDIACDNFQNVNIDLIFGAKNQTIDEWQADLNKAISLPVKHISAYCLEFESGTGVCAGNAKAIDQQEKEVEFLNLAISTLTSASFNHYEISNYAKENYACKHNLNTWQMGEWIGLGAAAASQFENKRRRNPYDLKAWAKNVENNWELSEDVVQLNDEELYSSAIIFGLRMIDGINLNTLKSRFPNANHKKYESTAKKLIEENLLEIHNNNLRLTPQTIPLADSIALEFL